MKNILLLAVVLPVLLCGCGKSTHLVDSQLPAPSLNQTPVTQNPGEIAVLPLHTTSGAPLGIRLSWFAVVDSADGGSRIDGYHIYKSQDSIPDSARGDDSFWIEIDGNALIDQPMIPGNEIVVDDIFAAAVGETWHYRLASVATDGDESALSPETTVVIAPFIVDVLLTTSAGVGATVQIQGQYFGVFDSENDKVEVRGVVWEDGVGFNPQLLEAVITDWQPEMITIEVPYGATVGKIQVTVGGIPVDTPEVFENSDPYLTAINRTEGHFQNAITFTGKHFGDAMDNTNRVTYSGTQLVAAGDYTAYSDTEITFNPLNLQDYAVHEVTVNVDTISSNSAFPRLNNAPPVAKLNGIPVVGTVPLNLRFNASGSLDPENDKTPNNGITTYHWDFDGDGIFNETGNGEAAARGSSQPQYTYTVMGEYNPSVRVFDVEMDMTPATIAVVAGNPKAPTIFDDAAQPDPNDPGQVDNINAPDYVVNLYYGIAEGYPSYTVEVDADYVEVVPGDPVASFGQNDATQVFETDNSPIDAANPNIQDTVTVTKAIPGNYVLAIRVTDALDRKAVVVYPTAVKYNPPSNIAVIHDEEGDPSGAGPTVSDSVLTMLTGKGYWAQIKESAGLLNGDLDGFDACVWVSNGSRGTDPSPFEWLGVADLALIRQFEDSGRSVIIISPPASTLGNDLFADALFYTDYQPFRETNYMVSTVDEDFSALDFTGNGNLNIVSVQYVGPYSDTNDTGIHATATSEMEWNDTGVNEPIAAYMPGPIGGNLYFAMFSIPSITSLDPAVLGTEDLLDNIVSGTIARQ